MEKFNVGETVRIKNWDDLAAQYGLIAGVNGDVEINTPNLTILAGAIRNCCGSVCKITMIDETSACVDTNKFFWPLEALEEINDDLTWKSVIESFI